MKSSPGTYALILKATRSQSAQVGKRENIDLVPGFYIYAGSARGPGGLKARVARHLRTTKRCHWHIDYLTTRIPVIEVWYSYSSLADECQWAAALLADRRKYTEVPGLGASDCSCPSHLFYSGRYPRPKDIAARIAPDSISISIMKPVLSSLAESHQAKHQGHFN
jgi:Uri superfamily endonuclease